MARGTERDLTDLERLDKGSRQVWANACAATLISVMGLTGCQVLVAQGFQAFLPRARAEWSGHAFQYDDFKAIFHALQLVAESKVTPAAMIKSLLTIRRH